MAARRALSSALFVCAAVNAASGPDFVHDVAPILYRSCTPCHRPGEAGPFPLLSYHDAQNRAAQIAAVTRSRYMPPWLPEAGRGNFEGDRRLSAAEIQTITDWAESGAREGPPNDAPPFPAYRANGWQFGEPDLVLEHLCRSTFQHQGRTCTGISC